MSAQRWVAASDARRRKAVRLGLPSLSPQHSRRPVGRRPPRRCCRLRALTASWVNFFANVLDPRSRPGSQRGCTKRSDLRSRQDAETDQRRSDLIDEQSSRGGEPVRDCHSIYEPGRQPGGFARAVGDLIEFLASECDEMGKSLRRLLVEGDGLGATLCGVAFADERVGKIDTCPISQ